ncbi:type I DNA topoisomerase [Anaerostipes sp. MSJ-23]|uniref:type I DNA topoisomerase n=1 Tax=Anaerostipes sp. MSJ-23 TaxID=2841520 RepID=UPI001C0F8608|nr:type I DNA topoisomerase [Anaerostipes sp. MSJ-23]MBU5460460.1 type I DNA topoisomerase [Anaerostipes sp. MSJ-23]
MPKYLVIVESPAKAKTIKKFLGKNYEVIASNGHVRDLPKSTLGIDIENDFEPKYITIRGKGEVLAALRKAVKKADKVYLATDPDREGEAISWHLYHALKLENKKCSRITFNEITKNAVKDSIKHAREIDMNLVDAQQARRVLDRIVGYQISPILWAKIKRGLSAGRVQSVALRLICDREEEINLFIPKEYWSLTALLNVKESKKPLEAKFVGHKDKKEKVEIHNKEEMDQILKELEGKEFKVEGVKVSERTKKCPLPFTTSTLQQDASSKLNFPTQKTMRIAQQLYEGVDIKGKGTVGLITYLRTDSTRISEEADTSAKEYIAEHYGEEYVGVSSTPAKKSDKKVQDAHEAIRPTYMENSPASIKDQLSRDQFRLYQLIWNRFIASRMAAARYENTSVKIIAGDYRFTAAASKIAFDGFLSVYNINNEKSEGNVMIKSIDEDTELSLNEFESKQHFTQPPAHYTEASLVKTLEELGIGRPSTYAPTISTIVARRYVVKEKKNLYVTELGEAVNNMMKKAFATIVDVNFTAMMEALLDMVEEGKVHWKSVIENFYPDFEIAVKNAEKELEKVKIEDEVTDVVCDQCGRNMVVKYGPYGKFLACPGFPECRNTKPHFEKVGVPCPLCGGEVVLKKTKKGRKYYGCENNPECEFISWQKPSTIKCKRCGSYMIEKGKKLVCSNKKCGYVCSRPEELDQEETQTKGE